MRMNFRKEPEIGTQSHLGNLADGMKEKTIMALKITHKLRDAAQREQKLATRKVREAARHLDEAVKMERFAEELETRPHTPKLKTDTPDYLTNS